MSIASDGSSAFSSTLPRDLSNLGSRQCRARRTNRTAGRVVVAMWFEIIRCCICWLASALLVLQNCLPISSGHHLEMSVLAHKLDRASHTMQMLLPFNRILGSCTFPSAGSLPSCQSHLSVSNMKEPWKLRTSPSRSPRPCLFLLE